MAGSSSHCSTRITTNMGFSRSSCSTARAASSPPCFVPPSVPVAKRSAPFYAGCCGRSAPTGPGPRFCCAATVTIAVPRFSTGVGRMASTSSSASRRPPTLRRHIGDLEGQHKARFEAAPKEAKARRFKEFFDGAASWSRVERIVACRGRRGRARHTLHRYQPEGPQRSCTLRGCLLPARPGGKPYQILEDASDGRPHFLHQGHSQPAVAVPARRRLLAYVGPARVDAKAFNVARRAV